MPWQQCFLYLLNLPVKTRFLHLIGLHHTVRLWLSLGLGHSKRWNCTCKVPPLFCPMISGGVVPTWNVYSFSLVPAWVWSSQLTSSSINGGRSPTLRWLEAPLCWREALYWVQHQAFAQQVEFLGMLGCGRRNLLMVTWIAVSRNGG